jgi:hypothetical protein
MVIWSQQVSHRMGRKLMESLKVLVEVVDSAAMVAADNNMEGR